MKNRILTIALSLAIGFGFFSCQKHEDPKPMNQTNIPVRVAKTFKKQGVTGVNDGFTSYVITTSEGYSYTLTFQENNGYTTLLVTQPGGTSPIGGACIERIIAVLEKWINASQTLFIEDNACSITRQFVNDFRALRDCVPAEAQGEFDEAFDEIDLALDQYCQ